MKFVRILFACAVLISLTSAARADGNKLLLECQEAERFMDSKEIRDQFDIGRCLGFIAGIKSALMILEDPKIKVCWPKSEGNYGITHGQAVRVVLKYLRANPARLHQGEDVLVISAFMDAYPCK